MLPSVFHLSHLLLQGFTGATGIHPENTPYTPIQDSVFHMFSTGSPQVLRRFGTDVKPPEVSEELHFQKKLFQTQTEVYW